MLPPDDIRQNGAFDVGGLGDETTQEDRKGADAISALSDKVVSLERRLRDERFVFACVGIVLFDGMAFHSMPSWGGPVSILILEVIGLLVLARMLGVSELVQLTQELLDTLKRR